MRQDQRQGTEYGRRHRHRDGPETRACGLPDRAVDIGALVTADVGEFNDQNAVLGHDADQEHKTDLAVDVHRTARQLDRERRRGKAERHREKNDESARHAFKLRRQDQEDDQQRDAEDEGRVLRRLGKRLGFAQQRDRHVRFEHRFRRGLHLLGPRRPKRRLD